MEVRLTARDGCRLEDFQWNPACPELFAAACSDGSLSTVQFKPDGKGFEVLGSVGLASVVPNCCKNGRKCRADWVVVLKQFLNPKL